MVSLVTRIVLGLALTVALLVATSQTAQAGTRTPTYVLSNGAITLTFTLDSRADLR